MEVFGSNIISENGESYIPASQRPDGTWRKARRVKEGYVPQEEVPLYESKGKQFANRMSKPVTITLPTGEIARQAIPGLFIVEEKEQKSKNKKKGKSSNKQTTDELSKKLENIEVKEVFSEKQPKQDKQTAPNQKFKQPENSQAVVPAKRLKNLKKRLREVEALEEKLKNGSIAKPDPDQLKKVERKNELLLEIEQLEKKN